MTQDTQAEMLEAAAAEVEATGAVTMGDGSVQKFGAKAKMKKTADVNTGECKFLLKNGSVITFNIPGFDPNASIQVRTLSCHGALQMIGDRAVHSTDADDIEHAIRTKIKAIESGKFDTRESSTGIAGLADVALATCRQAGMNPDDMHSSGVSNLAFARNALMGLTPEQFAAHKASPEISYQLKAIATEKAEAKLKASSGNTGGVNVF
jgi:hypothetical protein